MDNGQVADRYVVISADGHVGADLHAYRDYLASNWHDEFDRWVGQASDPYGDNFISADPCVNWDSAARMAATESDGVVAEVLFPNTIPPFFPQTQVFVPPPPTNREDYERRWAGLQAHNRWLVDFCGEAPGRRAGLAQVMLNDVDDAVHETQWVKANGLAGILLPGVPPGSDLPPLWSAEYEPLWAVCQELDLPVVNHGGSGLPDYGTDPVGQVMQSLEGPWMSHRPLWHLIYAGVFDRYPQLRLVLTEQGAGWVPSTLRALDGRFAMFRTPGSSSSVFGGEAAGRLKQKPSEYFAQNVWIGASFIHREEVEIRYETGVDRIMWGQDFPHREGTYPYSTQAIQFAFHGLPQKEIQMMLSETAAKVFGFDLAALSVPAAKYGPTVHDIAQAPGAAPSDTFCKAFGPMNHLLG